MRPALTRLAGVAVAAAVLAIAYVVGFGPQSGRDLVTALPGQNGLVAELYRGKGGAASSSVRLSAGGRGVEVLRLDGVLPAMQWLGPAKLMVCVDDADVLFYAPEAEVGPGPVEVLVAPQPADACGG